ncbi:MAG: hypothetical protein ACSHWQ_00790 [Spongiibacteraceae bacterium]
MSLTRNVFAASLCLGALLACSAKEEPATGVIPEHQLQAIDKANNVGQQMQDDADARAKAMKEQGY